MSYLMFLSSRVTTSGIRGNSEAAPPSPEQLQ